MSSDFEEYMETGMLGGYTPERAIKRKLGDKVLPLYRDTTYSETEEGIELKREMTIGGRRFIVCSVFPSFNAVTPTQKMLRVIENDLEKK